MIAISIACDRLWSHSKRSDRDQKLIEASPTHRYAMDGIRGLFYLRVKHPSCYAAFRQNSLTTCYYYHS